MKKTISGILFIFFWSLNLMAQNDSLNVFRNSSKTNSGSKSHAGGGNNSLSLSLAHIGRGGTILTYERLINNTPIAIFAGYGFSKMDFIGQFSLDDEDFFYSNLYTEKKSADMGTAFDIGMKYAFDEELGGNYLGLCYSSYQNSIIQEVDYYYDVSASSSRSNRLNYSSKEFKLVYGSMGDSESRFYNDFSVGAGLRILNYQKLDITEVPVVNNNNYYGYETEFVVNKRWHSEVKPWLFIGWKIGLRF